MILGSGVQRVPRRVSGGMHGRILLAFALLACDAKTEPTTPEGGSILDITMSSGQVRVNGITAAGAGYDGEITCK